MGKSCWVKSLSIKILVMGAGAIGSLYGGLLAETENKVTFIARKPHVESIRKNGLTIEGLINKKIKNIKAETNPSNLVHEKFDLILITVKAYDTFQASTQIKPLTKNNPAILCLQNGIGVEGEASKILGKFSLLRGVSFCGSYMSEPGKIVSTGLGKTIIGEPYNQNSGIAGVVKEVFEEAGFPTFISANIHGTVWTKTLVNAGINPFGTLTKMRNGELLEDENLKKLMIETVKEGVKVAEKLKIRLDEDPVRLMVKTAKATFKNLNSMLQDLLKGKKTEIDYINGAISRFGKKLNQPTPLNDLLTAFIKAVEKKMLKEKDSEWKPSILQKIL
ncbi:MAG: 2-dehydropantoate 2-reductase [Candidatus Hecatellales archaeon ex4484_218]|nr:MAG: 2-dehydropantoate 2-reductase [Candidatus Hecatellales archaeon ex4484_218]